MFGFSVFLLSFQMLIRPLGEQTDVGTNHRTEKKNTEVLLFCKKITNFVALFKLCDMADDRKESQCLII